MFCVYEKDSNDKNFSQAIKILKRLENTDSACKIIAVSLIPCFEFWYLLHVSYSNRSYSGVDSLCKHLIKKLQSHKIFQNYDKSSCGEFYDEIANKRSFAIDNAKRILISAQESKLKDFHEDPSTRVHIVVERLLNLAI